MWKNKLIAWLGQPPKHNGWRFRDNFGKVQIIKNRPIKFLTMKLAHAVGLWTCFVFMASRLGAVPNLPTPTASFIQPVAFVGTSISSTMPTSAFVLPIIGTNVQPSTAVAYINVTNTFISSNTFKNTVGVNAELVVAGTSTAISPNSSLIIYDRPASTGQMVVMQSATSCQPYFLVEPSDNSQGLFGTRCGGAMFLQASSGVRIEQTGGGLGPISTGYVDFEDVSGHQMIGTNGTIGGGGYTIQLGDTQFNNNGTMLQIDDTTPQLDWNSGGFHIDGSNNLSASNSITGASLISNGSLAVTGNSVITGNITVVSTETIKGNAFSVGGSTFSISGALITESSTTINGRAIISSMTTAGLISNATNGLLISKAPTTGLALSGGVLSSNAAYTISFQPGLLSSVLGAISVYGKVSATSTVDNLIGSALSFTCVANPTITFYECSTSATCATPTTIGTVTVTGTGQAFTGTVSNPAITAGDFVAWAMTAGTCTSLDVSATAQVHAN